MRDCPVWLSARRARPYAAPLEIPKGLSSNYLELARRTFAMPGVPSDVFLIMADVAKEGAHYAWGPGGQRRPLQALSELFRAAAPLHADVALPRTGPMMLPASVFLASARNLRACGDPDCEGMARLLEEMGQAAMRGDLAAGRVAS